MGGVFGCVSGDIWAILSAGTECKDSLWDSSGDRILGHSPFISSSLAFWTDLEGYSKTAESLLKSSLLPVRGVVVCTEIGMLMQDILSKLVLEIGVIPS